MFQISYKYHTDVRRSTSILTISLFERDTDFYGSLLSIELNCMPTVQYLGGATVNPAHLVPQLYSSYRLKVYLTP